MKLCLVEHFENTSSAVFTGSWDLISGEEIYNKQPNIVTSCVLMQTFINIGWMLRSWLNNACVLQRFFMDTTCYHEHYHVWYWATHFGRFFRQWGGDFIHDSFDKINVGTVLQIMGMWTRPGKFKSYTVDIRSAFDSDSSSCHNRFTVQPLQRSSELQFSETVGYIEDTMTFIVRVADHPDRLRIHAFKHTA